MHHELFNPDIDIARYQSVTNLFQCHVQLKYESFQDSLMRCLIGVMKSGGEESDGCSVVVPWRLVKNNEEIR